MTDAAHLESDPMCPTMNEPYPADFFSRMPVDADIRAYVSELLLTTRQPACGAERRRDRRYPYPRLVRLTPVGPDGHTPCGAVIVVAGKTLSEGGCSFYHPEPLSHRRMIAAFLVGGGRWKRFLIELPWCRFTTEGWYESGARFLQALPAEQPPTADAEMGNPDQRHEP
jgi:hypothetical protein